MRGMSSALSAASSACDHIRDWVKGTPSGTWVSMGVFSDGSYGAPKVIHVKHLVQYRNFHSFIWYVSQLCKCFAVYMMKTCRQLNCFA